MGLPKAESVAMDSSAEAPRPSELPKVLDALEADDVASLGVGWCLAVDRHGAAYHEEHVGPLSDPVDGPGRLLTWRRQDEPVRLPGLQVQGRHDDQMRPDVHGLVDAAVAVAACEEQLLKEPRSRRVVGGRVGDGPVPFGLGVELCGELCGSAGKVDEARLGSIHELGAVLIVLCRHQRCRLPGEAMHPQQLLEVPRRPDHCVALEEAVLPAAPEAPKGARRVA